MRLYLVSFVISALVAFSSLEAEVPGNDPEIDRNRFSVGVTGSIPPALKWSHQSMLEYVKCQDLFLAIARKPRTEKFVADSLAGLPFGLKEIMALKLLRQEAGIFYLNFSFLTQQDQKLIYEVSERYGQSLTQAFAGEWGRFRGILESNEQSHIPDGLLAYILLGLISLDWDGLDLTAELDMRNTATHTDDPESVYTPWAKEKGDLVSLKGLYWGSHNDDQLSSDFVFTTFGDHDALPRRAMPDIYWSSQVKLSGAEGDLKNRNYAAMRFAIRDIYRKYGGLLFALKNAPMSRGDIRSLTGWSDDEFDAHIKLLQEIQVVSLEKQGYVAAIVVLEETDGPMVAAIRQFGWAIMEDWLQENYGPIKTDLGGLAPVSQGVPFEFVFTQVWHYIFGLTNRDLVRAGLFVDPYGNDRTYKGYFPALWEQGLIEDFGPS